MDDRQYLYCAPRFIHPSQTEMLLGGNKGVTSNKKKKDLLIDNEKLQVIFQIMLELVKNQAYVSINCNFCKLN